jgi:hypothetical protein
MARIKFKEGSEIQRLSGKIGNITYRTAGGKTFVFATEVPELPKDATRKQKSQYKKRMIIDQCVAVIQREMELEVALAMRQKLRDRMDYLYKRLAPEIKARTKLQKTMMMEYYKRFSIEKDSIMIREKLGLVPLEARKGATNIDRSKPKTRNLQIFISNQKSKEKSIE